MNILRVIHQGGHLTVKDMSFSFKILFLERGEGKEKERERNINVWLPLARPQSGSWPATQACALTGNRTTSLEVRRPVLNPLSHTVLRSGTAVSQLKGFHTGGQKACQRSPAGQGQQAG